MTHTADAGGRAASPSVELPDRTLFWKWVWSSVRPVVGWVLAAAGAITLLIGWFGVSGESLTAKQLPYLASAGLAGVALFIMAAVFLATDDVRRQFARIAELERKVDDLYTLFVADLAATGSGGATRPRAVTAGDAYVALPSGTSYHRPDCALVAGKEETATVTAADIKARSLRACRVCDPASTAVG